MDKDMKIEYVTGNLQKFQEAQHILEGYELEQVNIELTEIQGDSLDIIKAKAKEAYRILQRPLIVEDVSICCPAINDLPGPYIKDFLRKLSDVGFCELIHKFDDHRVRAICLAAYIDGKQQPQVFEGVTEGVIVKPKGNTRHGTYSWNCIFLPNGFNKTFGEMSLKEHSQVSMRNIALLKLKDYLENNKSCQ